MNFKKTISALMCSITIFSSVQASMLGSETIKHARLDIGKGAVMETNVFYGDQSGVGNQSEYFVEYTPNDSVVPWVITGDVYGKDTLSSMANSLIDGGIYPTMLMNSDFFAINTGVPLSHQVIDGELTVMDAQDMDAIGFLEDGSAFISYLSLGVKAKIGENEFDIGVVNKVRQPYAIYLYTDKFSESTHTSEAGINVIIGSLSGKLTPGETIEGVVETVTEDTGAIGIPQGKIVLSADLNLDENILNNMKLLKEGDKIELTVTAEGDKRWSEAKHILGAWGGVIIKNSEIMNVDDDAAPRTAFGIKEDGSLIFYTLDGRQSGHSYGARLKTLAKRLKELGCVDAVNLDGGGSTTLGTVYPGSDYVSVVNKPSDGAQRQVATFLALLNTEDKSDKAERLFIYPYTENYLSGATETFRVYATDKNYYKTDVPGEVEFIAPGGKISTDGKMKITGDGKVTVGAKAGSLETEIEINCYKTPTSIIVQNASKKTKVSSLVFSPEESIDLDAAAYVGNKKLIGDDTCFTWDCTGEIGSVDKNGKFTATDEEAKGEITVTAGNYTKKIPVEVKIKKPYIDITFEEGNSGEVTIHFDTDSAIDISEENISVKADGKEVETVLTGRKMNLIFSDNNTHKISVSAMNTGGYKTVAFFTTKGEKHENIFADIDDTHWAKDYVTYMNYHGVVNGVAKDNKLYFMPVNDITRAEFAVMVANVMGIKTEDFSETEVSLKDAQSLAPWCENHIKALYELGIMTGKQDGDGVIFDPAATLTRGEAATVLSRLLPDMIETEEMKFADKDEIPSWCEDAFTKLTSLGIINGYFDGTLKPKNNITRAEIIKMLYIVY